MSEISSIEGSPSSLAEYPTSENISEKSMPELVADAEKAIDQKNFERVTQIISHLSEVHFQSTGFMHCLMSWVSPPKLVVTHSDLYHLFSKLCHADAEEGDKVIPIIQKNFSTIKHSGRSYSLYDYGFSRSFTLPNKLIISNEKMEELVEEAKKAIKAKNYSRVAETILQLELSNQQPEVSRFQKLSTSREIFGLSSGIFNADVEEGRKLIPILSKHYKIQLEQDYFQMSAPGFTAFSEIPFQSDAEAKNLIDKILTFTKEKKLAEVEHDMDRLIQMLSDKRVGFADFVKFYRLFCVKDLALAKNYISRLENYFTIHFNKDCLVIIHCSHNKMKNLKGNYLGRSEPLKDYLNRLSNINEPAPYFATCSRVVTIGEEDLRGMYPYSVIREESFEPIL